jgi:hypothetical protein
MHREFLWENLLENCHFGGLRRKWKYKIQKNFGNVSCEDGLWMELWIWLGVIPLVGFGTSSVELSVLAVIMTDSGHGKPVTKQIIN